MNINMYVINAILVLMVVRQVREHPLDLRSLAAPVLAVGCAAVLFLHSVPTGGHDLVLELVCVSAGAVMGGIGGLATRLRRTLVTVADHAGPPGPGSGPRPAPLAGAGGGHGLAAMRERAQRAGGTARAGPTADGWLVELQVPA
jgi:hypothetical protein